MNKPQQKIKKAKQLLWEATDEIRSKEKTDREKDLCKCRHKRKDHSISYSVNYTEGFCKKCNCKWFNYKNNN